MEIHSTHNRTHTYVLFDDLKFNLIFSRQPGVRFCRNFLFHWYSSRGKFSIKLVPDLGKIHNLHSFRNQWYTWTPSILIVIEFAIANFVYAFQYIRENMDKGMVRGISYHVVSNLSDYARQ